MTPQLETHPTADALHRAAARRIASTLEEALARAPAASIALTGGKTPEPIYELLAGAPYRERLAWARIDFFWGDERPVGPESPESNFGMARRSLLDRVAVPEERIHRIEGESEGLEDAARRYEAEVRRVVAGAPVPRFDLVLLGMGDDGHTASLFPGTVWDGARLVTPNFVPKLGATRITMTPRLINAARAVLFLVSGASKAEALARVFRNPPDELPAAQIRPADGSLLWLVDRAAASRLSS
jgi:6-phosphogluconolactonase